MMTSNEKKTSCAPPNQYKATLCTTKSVSVQNFMFLKKREKIGPPCAPWCITQIGGAQHRSMVHSIAQYHQCGAQGSFNTPTYTW